ncbi:hypothetical protein AAG570_006816 [Ranatra chinensis]|uniref:Uncharacterized protein n=1 Tax=Ranatra chinensis TaxID=642074 RepID=A0ABD0YV64_9HEMI
MASKPRNMFYQNKQQEMTKRGSTLNGQTVLEFWQAGGAEGVELRVKSAMLWVKVEPTRAKHPPPPPPHTNFTLWAFTVHAHLPNATRLSGKVPEVGPQELNLGLG